MGEQNFKISNPKDLKSVAEALIEFCSKPCVVAFSGEMGAGKTTFIKMLCKQLGVEETVSSPTFSLVNEYKDSKGNSVFHFDFYRIKNEREAFDIGCEEYFYKNCFCFVEWSEKILNLLPEYFVQVSIQVEGEIRHINFRK